MFDPKVEEIIGDYTTGLVSASRLGDLLFTFNEYREKECCLEVVFPKCFDTTARIALIGEAAIDAVGQLVGLIERFNKKLEMSAVLIADQKLGLFGPSMICNGSVCGMAELGNEILSLLKAATQSPYDCSFSESYWDPEPVLAEIGLKNVAPIANTALWYVKTSEARLESELYTMLYNEVAGYKTVGDTVNAINVEDLSQSLPDSTLLKEQLCNQLILRLFSEELPAFDSYWMEKIRAIEQAHSQFATPKLKGFLRGAAAGLWAGSVREDLQVALATLVAWLLGKKVLAAGVADSAYGVKLKTWPLPARLTHGEGRNEIGFMLYRDGVFTFEFRIGSCELDIEQRQLVLPGGACVLNAGNVVVILE